jgi:L,D-transpeptidase YbiS
MPDRYLEIDLCRQILCVVERGSRSLQFSVSTSKFGPGEEVDSGCTPRGAHVIRSLIGSGLPAGTCFTGRRHTGEFWTQELAESTPDRDWILSRIIWLSGCEPGYNRLGTVDTMRRYIYIHGTPDTEPMGVPFSHGCIRMRNADVIKLFDLVTVGMSVEILT